MIQLTIDTNKIKEARNYAAKIVNSLTWLLQDYTSTTIERTVLRLMGIDGIAGDNTPIPNLVV
ncbi:MAG TPA: D-lysine 5,6-aminomutase subunit alpha, partial [Candidatus Cloacimonas sp.]|nr:D-lysine 5,6-aminomutase subunit alpha [Candidatus Cloacimonas sp.]